MKPLAEKIALVTGASSGIGRAIALRLAADGAFVIVNYNQNADSAREITDKIEAQGGQASALQADVSDIGQIQTLFQSIIKRCGRLDIVVNNAGIAGQIQPIVEVTEENFDTVFALNVKGALFVLKSAARHLSENGRIINISSSVTQFPMAGLAVYSASKAVLKVFTEVLAKEVGERGITVNSILPGATVPGMFEQAPDEFKQQAIALSPFSRLGTPEDTADIVAFLASDQARWITGQHILANGGATI